MSIKQVEMFFGRAFLVVVFVTLYAYGFHTGGENVAAMIETIMVTFTAILFLYTDQPSHNWRSTLSLFVSFAVSSLVMGTHSLAVTSWTKISTLTIIASLSIIAIAATIAKKKRCGV